MLSKNQGPKLQAKRGAGKSSGLGEFWNEELAK